MKGLPWEEGTQVTYQYKVSSSQGRQPNRTPLPKNCIDLGPYLWLDSLHPLMAVRPVKMGFLKPNHFATPEFTPSQPISTFHPGIGTKINGSYMILKNFSLISTPIYLFSIFKFTIVFNMVPSARCTSLKKPDSSMQTTLEENLMVPLGSSFARASNSNFLFTHRTSWFPLEITADSSY